MGQINDLRINNLQPGCFRVVASRRQKRPSTSADVASAPGDEPLDLGAAGLLQRLGLRCPATAWKHHNSTVLQTARPYGGRADRRYLEAVGA